MLKYLTKTRQKDYDVYTFNLHLLSVVCQIDIYIKLKSVYAKIYHDIMNNKNKFGFTPKLVPNSFLCLLVYDLGHSLSLPNS